LTSSPVREKTESDADTAGDGGTSGAGLDLESIRQKSIAAAEEAIRKAGSRPDLHLVQAIQALDDADKFLNVTSTRAAEWYGLHFPELTQMVQDNAALCKMILAAGRRDGFTSDLLQGRGFTEKKVEAILSARDRSKGGDITDVDLARVKALSAIAVEIGAEREKLNEYVEGAMRRIAPNVCEIAGATIGARLMAKAGGLDRLAVLPASTIQILGAEKALFRALRTGARPPKHGVLFQHEAVHAAPKWQRGKIARTIANKIAIAARVDYYRGSAEESIKAGLDKRLENIREKYKEPPSPLLRERREGGRGANESGRRGGYGNSRGGGGGEGRYRDRRGGGYGGERREGQAHCREGRDDWSRKKYKKKFSQR